MSWSSPLDHPVKLKDGRVLRTLREAADLILGLGDAYHHAAWTRYAVELLISAAESGQAEAISLATHQVERPLKREGMM